MDFLRKLLYFFLDFVKDKIVVREDVGFRVIK